MLARGHRRANAATGIVVVALAFSYGLLSPFEILLLGAAIIAGEFFLSPDLDLPQSRCNQSWGALGVIWYGYARLFRHRRLSHVPGVGSLTRIAYLGLVALVLYWLATLAWHLATDEISFDAVKTASRATFEAQGIVWRYLEAHSRSALVVLAGFTIADTVHLVADHGSSLTQRWRSSAPAARKR